MAKVRITKEFNFEMAHVLYNYDGLCSNIHGHSYKLLVTVLGDIAEDDSSHKLGMVMDFSILKSIVTEEIVSRLDHDLMVYDKFPNINALKAATERFYSTPYQPTCENMVVDFARRIRARLPQGISLFSVRLHETATSYAEWFASDNE